MSKIFDRKSAADFLLVSERTIDRLRVAGKLSFRKIGDRVLMTEGDLFKCLDAGLVEVQTGRETRKAETIGGQK